MIDIYQPAYPRAGVSTAPGGTQNEFYTDGMSIGTVISKDILVALVTPQSDAGIANLVANALEGKEECLYSDEEIKLLVSTSKILAAELCKQLT